MNIDLKQYLMQDFPNSKYKNTSLIRLYELDNEYYQTFVKKGKIPPEAITFFATKSKDVKQIGRSNIEALKPMGYESLINQYLEECATAERRKEEKARQKEEERIRKEEERKAQELAKKQQAAKEKEERKKKLIQEAVKAAAPKIIEVRNGAPEWLTKKTKQAKKRETQEAKRKRRLERENEGKHIQLQPDPGRMCQTHLIKMDVESVIKLRTGKTLQVYKCPMCYVSTIYTSKEKDIREPHEPCYVYGKNIPSVCSSCGVKLIRTDEYTYKSSRYKCLKICPKCKCFYVPWEIYMISTEDWEPKNSIDDVDIDIPISHHSSKKSKKRSSNTNNGNSEFVFSQSERKTTCWVDNIPMKISKRIVFQNRKSIPVYECPECHLTLMYTSGETDIRPAYSPCWVYGKDVPRNCSECDKPLIRTDEFVLNGQEYRRVKYCSDCNRFYVPYDIYEHETMNWRPMNSSEQLKTFKEEIAKRKENREHKKTKSSETTTSKSNREPEKEAEIPEVPIAFKDFVIRRNVFKCKKSGHNLRNITGIVKIMTKFGSVKDVSVPAGHCPTCDRYFLMESTYQMLKEQGIILCRVSDEKSYLNSYDDQFFNSEGMAQSSILKQCGYSVSQNSYLTSDARKKLLCMIIDNGILTSSDVLSYLDWFIRMREGQYSMRNAIEKWQSDLDYIRRRYSRSWDSYRARSISR